ncbi:MAG: C10 family peptidase [Lentisphaeria bacterium]|nr:C10 family peptidase [Lentisphaeria bacterium]
MSDYTVIPGNADGKILTSTQWQQDGRVVVDGQELEGQIYNRFCPWLSPNSRIRSVTGCTNTADAQILYYFLEQGWDLQFTVSSDDYFTLGTNRGRKYYLSETSAVGEGTVSELNEILADTENYSSGEFIAALNFFCGVKNHSTYGESTGTSVYIGTFYDGKTNLKAFRAAGFDSYFSVSANNELFFDDSGKYNRLTAVAYSIIRENLDYGEPVRVDIPGHSIYLDGYRWNSYSGEFEYHLNYGWGYNSPYNRWYTTDEIYEISFDTLGLDLTPKVRVTVTNARSDYYGGAFLRGIERINHIQNDTATTFAFVEDIAGECIFLDTVEFTSEVDLEFTDWNIYLCVSGADALISGNGLIFSGQTGGIIVNSADGGSCVRLDGNEQLQIELDGGCYFTGESELDFAGIKGALAEFWKHEEELLNWYDGTADAIISGDADDIVSLNDMSVIVGGIALGGGKNVVNIESGSAVYGNITGEKDSVELNLTASETVDHAMIGLTVSAEEFLAATGGNINFTVTGSEQRTYNLVTFLNSSELDDFSVTVLYDDEEFYLDSSTMVNGNFALQYIDNTLAVICSGGMPLISVSVSETAWTAGEVTVSAIFSLAGESVAGEYSLDDGENWFAYESPLIFTENGSVIFRSEGERGWQYKSCTVSNIDKEAPEITDISIEFSKNFFRASVSAEFADNAELSVMQYKIGEDGVYQAYSGAITVNENCMITFRAVDAAGNISEKTVEIDQIQAPFHIKDDIDGNGVADILMSSRQLASGMKFHSGAWLISEDGKVGWGNLSQLNMLNRFLGTGWNDPEKAAADIYILNEKNNSVGAWITGENGEISHWESIGKFDDKTNVLALGDFNGDKVSDLLLQNVNGAVGCALVKDGTCTWNYFQSLGKEWQLSAVGDFNGDGLSDLVLSHDAGFAGCWLTQSDGTVVWSDLDTLKDGIKVVGAGDFNGDGVDDVLLQKDDYFGAWIVENGNAAEWFGIASSAGVVEQIGDFDGDGIDDIRLRTSGGDLGALLIKGEDQTQWRYFGSVGSEWNTAQGLM